MGSVLTLVRVDLKLYSFRLLWNGQAEIEWNSRYPDNRDVTTSDFQGMAELLCLMGREAAAFCRAYGYEPDEVPAEKELEQYFAMTAPGYERKYAMDCLNAALAYSNTRDYKPADESHINVDAIELKKN